MPAYRAGFTMGSSASFVKGEPIRARKPAVKTGRRNKLFAVRFRVAMAERDWTAADIARQLGVSRQLVASWARGRAEPRGAAAARLPELLAVPATWLFPRDALVSGADSDAPRLLAMLEVLRAAEGLRENYLGVMAGDAAVLMKALRVGALIRRAAWKLLPEAVQQQLRASGVE